MVSSSSPSSDCGPATILSGPTPPGHAPKAVVDDDGVPRDRQKRKKALLIGIDYITLERSQGRMLKGHDSVDIIKNLLTEVYSYDMHDITVMKDHNKTSSQLQPTRDNIIREMVNLVFDPIESDEFFIYYAGHATQREERGASTESEHQAEFLLPVDAMDEEGEVVLDNAIIGDELREILVQPLIHADVKCQLVAVMDACTSGTILDIDHDLCNKMSGWKSLGYRIARSVLETLSSTQSRFHAGILKGPKDPIYACNRVCNRRRLQMKANIIWMSACGDSQNLIELPGGKTLAEYLDVYLRKHRYPSLKDLNRYIYNEFKKTNNNTWRSYSEEVKKYKKHLRRYLPERPPEASKPQITSIKPLRMGTTLKL